MNLIFKVLVLLCIAVKLNAQTTSAQHIAISKTAEKNGNYVQALQALNKALAIEPNNVSFIQYKFDLLVAKKDFGNAINTYKTLDSLKAPMDASFIMKIAKMYSQLGQKEKCIKLLQSIAFDKLETVEQKTYYYNTLADVDNSINSTLQAIDLWEKSILLNANQPVVYTKLAKASDNLERFKAACFYYKKAMVLDTSNYSLAYNGGQACGDARQFDESLKIFENLKQKYPQNKQDLEYQIGGLYFEQKDYDKAIATFLEIKSSALYQMDVMRMLAYSYYYSTDQKKARKQINDMLIINPDDADLYYFLGMSYQKDDDMGKATYYFEKAIKMKPELGNLKRSKGLFN